MMSRLGPRPHLVLLPAIILGSLIGCARQDAPAPVVWHGASDDRAAPPPAHAPPPPSAGIAPPAAYAPPRYTASARPPAPAAAAGPVPAAAGPSAEPPPHPHPDKVLVVDGDTLWSMSRRHGLPVRSIIDANNLQPPYRLVSGSILVLPQVRQHIVRTGDTLYSISRLYGIDTSTLARLNHLDAPYYVKLDETLIIPPPYEGSQVAAARPPPPAPSSTSASSTGASLTSPAPPADAVAASVPMPPVKPDRATPAAPAGQAAAPASPPGQLAALPPPPAFGGKGFIWPVEGRILGGYGEGPGGTHNDGINIAAPAGTPVLAADAGIVAYTGNELRGYGNLVLIKHAGGWMTAYAHNGAVLVKRGETVKRGQAIARVGATGAVSEPQLHFEIRKGTHALDPAGYLPATRTTAASD